METSCHADTVSWVSDPSCVVWCHINTTTAATAAPAVIRQQQAVVGAGIVTVISENMMVAPIAPVHQLGNEMTPISD